MEKVLHQPQSGNDVPRFAGRATMMRLPFTEQLEGLDAAFIGIPLDVGTSQRAGTRYGPRQIRAESVMIRPYNMATGAAPFDALSVADIGDVPINTYNLLKSVDIIEQYYKALNQYSLIPLTLGGDHTLTLPILRAIKEKHGPVALIHIDAHTDTNDNMFGEKIAHGTTFYWTVIVCFKSVNAHKATLRKTLNGELSKASPYTQQKIAGISLLSL